MRQCEAMRLVARALQKLQLGCAVVEPQRRAAPGQVHLLDALGQRQHGHAALAKAAQRGQARAQLAASAIDHDHVGKRRKARVVIGVVRRDVLLALPLRKAPRQHLGHRSVVVG